MKKRSKSNASNGEVRIRLACQVTYLNCLLESDNLTEHQRRLLVLALDENIGIRKVVNP